MPARGHFWTPHYILHYFASFLYTRSLSYNSALEMSRKGAMERIMMHSTPVRTMCLVVGMIVLMVRDGICVDDNGMYLNIVIGSHSCGRFVQEIQNSKRDVELFHR